jgi:hypothetical protein
MFGLYRHAAAKYVAVVEALDAEALEVTDAASFGCY